MGNGNGKHEFEEVQTELLRLSWRLACNDIVNRAMVEDATMKRSDSKVSEKKSSKLEPVEARTNLLNFHHEFMAQYFNLCPDIKSRFPKNHILVAKMIMRFLSELVKSSHNATLVSKLSKKFAKSHQQYNLRKEHFEGFGAALVRTIQARLGQFGTINLLNIWNKVVHALTDQLHESYLKERRRSSRKD